MNTDRDHLPDRARVGPHVSPTRPVQSEPTELSEVAFSLAIANRAVRRWMTRRMAPLAGLARHLLHRQARPRTVADICPVPNVEDKRRVSHALRELAGRGLKRAGICLAALMGALSGRYDRAARGAPAL